MLNRKKRLQDCFITLLLIMTLSVFISTNVRCEENWKLLYQPRQRIVKTIATFKKQIFIGTGNGVFISKDEGKTWKDFGINQLQKDSSGNILINWISIDKEKIYIATSFGAYYSGVDKSNWKKIFVGTKTSTTNENDDDNNEEINSAIKENEDDNLFLGEINSIEVDGNRVYLSSNDGLWICDLEKNLCKRLNYGSDADNLSGNYEAFSSLKKNNLLFTGTSNGIYLFNDKNQTWQKISTNIQKLPNGKINARFLYLDKEQNLWAACGTGAYFSKDNGKNWEKKSNGIKNNIDGFQETFYFFESSAGLYATCASGIYFLNKEQNLWKDISNGIRTKESAKNVYWLGKLDDSYYAATDEGLFTTNDLSSTIHDEDKPKNKPQTTSNKIVLKGTIETDFTNLEENEPSVVEVQKQALKFASLPTSNDYKRYRTQIRLRNLIPRVGIDLNSTGSSTNYFQFENGITTNTALNNDYNAGNISRLERDGKSYKQLSVLWNTNQLLYDDETWRILNQARLTANIKENLLDDVTKIYFQRKKSQLESLISPPEDTINKLSKELEIAELTGQLDSRTGGWFSKEIEKRKQVK